jgi:hypothetical protein
MKQYSFTFRSCTRNRVIPLACKSLKGMFKYEQIPDGAFNQTVMKRLKSAMDGTIVWIRRGYFNTRGSWAAYGIKVTDLAERLKRKKKKALLKKKAASVFEQISEMQKDKTVKKYLKLRDRYNKLCYS